MKNKKIYSDEFWLSQEQMQVLDKAEDEKLNWNLEAAMEILNEVLYEDPWCVPALEEIADCQLLSWQDDKSFKTAEFILELDENNYTAHYLLWFIYWKKTKFKESIKYLEEANKFRPNNPEVLRCYWWSLFMNKQRSKWVALLERARNLMPNDTQILNDLAVCMIETWNVSKWIDLLSEVQEIDPLNQRAIHTLWFIQKNVLIKE